MLSILKINDKYNDNLRKYNKKDGMWCEPQIGDIIKKTVD